MTINVKITASHIKDGSPGECTKCPIALALLEMGYGDVKVDEKSLTMIDGNGQRFTYKIPRDASLFILDYDQDYKVGPIVFDLLDLLPQED